MLAGMRCARVPAVTLVESARHELIDSHAHPAPVLQRRIWPCDRLRNVCLPREPQGVWSRLRLSWLRARERVEGWGVCGKVLRTGAVRGSVSVAVGGARVGFCAPLVLTSRCLRTTIASASCQLCLDLTCRVVCWREGAQWMHVLDSLVLGTATTRLTRLHHFTPSQAASRSSTHASLHPSRLSVNVNLHPRGTLCDIPRSLPTLLPAGGGEASLGPVTPC